MSSYLPHKIMIIDNDIICRTFLSNFLGRHGFSVITIGSGKEAINAIETLPESKKPNLIVIDSELTDISYLKVYSKLCDGKINTAPIIIMARAEDKFDLSKKGSIVLADYIIKPIDQMDFVTKIRDIFTQSKPVLQSKIISYGDIQMNLASFKVIRGNREIHLGPTEFKLLQHFIEEPLKIFSREELIEAVLEDRKNVELRTIDVHINRLRMALKNPWDQSSIIRTVRAAGYCLDLTETVQ